MYTKILCLIMGRAGTYAISKWLLSQYPVPVEYVSNSDVNSLSLVKEFCKDSSNKFRIFRQECEDIEKASKIIKSFTNPDKKDRIVIYSMRDPWNHAAARLQYWSLPEFESMLFYWPMNAKVHKIKGYVPNQKNILLQMQNKVNFLPSNSLFVNYNEWFSSQIYRQYLSEKLDLPTSENKIETVWHRSGFEDLTDSRKLDVFNRWKHYIYSIDYRKLFQDKELVEMSQTIFTPPFKVRDDEDATPYDY